MHHTQFVSYFLFKYCYIMLCIVFRCKWFPLAHGFSLVPLKLWHWSAIYALEAMRNLYSQGGLPRFYRGIGPALVQAGCGSKDSTSRWFSQRFARKRLMKKSNRCPKGYWWCQFLFGFQIHCTGREGNLKGTNIGVSGDPGVLTGSFDALRWLLGQRRSLGSLRGDSCREDVASCLASRKVGSSGGHFWTFSMKGCGKFQHFHFGSMFILFVSLGAGSK